MSESRIRSSGGPLNTGILRVDGFLRRLAAYRILTEARPEDLIEAHQRRSPPTQSKDGRVSSPSTNRDGLPSTAIGT